MKEIDLGKTGYGTEPVSMKQDKDAKHYPCLYIDGGSDLKDLPDSGIMTVAFKVNSRNISKRDDKTTCSISLDVKKILSVEESDDEETPSEETPTDTVLDNLAAELE